MTPTQLHLNVIAHWLMPVTRVNDVPWEPNVLRPSVSGSLAEGITKLVYMGSTYGNLPWMIMGKCRFNERWLRDDNYKLWLKCVDEWTAGCKLCGTSFELSNMGEQAIKSHARGTKHSTLISKHDQNMDLTVFLKPGPSNTGTTKGISTADSKTTSRPSAKFAKATSPAPVNTSHVIAKSLSSSISTNQTLEAEIIWCLKLNQSHWSYNSSDTTGIKVCAIFFPVLFIALGLD